MKTIQIRNNPELENQIETLKQVYRIKTDTKMLKHLVELDMRRL